MTKKYYAVKKGIQPGIYEAWDECKKQVQGFSGAVYKSFATLEEAQNFISEKKVMKQVEGKSLLAYVDGSYNIKTKEYGYGCVLLDEVGVVEKLYGKGNNEENALMRNVAGEILGSETAIDYAIQHQYQAIYIYYDYEGIEKWADGLWKANKAGTKAYQENVKEKRKQIHVEFIKVLAHSGDQYNEMADQLAKKAVGIKS